MTSAQPINVLLFSADLMTSSKVHGAAARQGVSLEVAGDVAALGDKSQTAQPALVILDLSAPCQDLGALVAQLKSNKPAPRVVAFGPHVHEGLLQAAREAGCDHVMSRGQFHAQVDQLLQMSRREAQ